MGRLHVRSCSRLSICLGGQGTETGTQCVFWLLPTFILAEQAPRSGAQIDPIFLMVVE
jgi:hypothetical protein